MYNPIISQKFANMGTIQARISSDATLVVVYSSSAEVVQIHNFDSKNLTSNQTLNFSDIEDVHIHKDNHYILFKNKEQIKLYRNSNSRFDLKSTILLDGSCSISVTGNFQFLTLTFS